MRRVDIHPELRAARLASAQEAKDGQSFAVMPLNSVAHGDAALSTSCFAKPYTDDF